MIRSSTLACAAGILLMACGSSFPPPSERLATAEAASRTARELQADKEPQAALHLRLASEQIETAKALMSSGDNKRADEILQRASADAELAVQLAKEASTRKEAQETVEELKQLKSGK